MYKGNPHGMWRAKQILLLTLVGGLALPTLTYLVPDPHTPTDLIPTGQFKPALASSVLMAWFYIGAATLFLAGLDVFKDRLRQAYWRICLGLCFLGVLLVQIPLLVAAGLFDTSWVTGGGYLLPYVVSWLIIYAGIRSFAKALGDTSQWVNAPFALAGVGALSGIAWLVVQYVADGEVAALVLAANVAHLGLIFVSTVLVLRIKNRAGPAYTNALAWFSLPLIVTLVAIALTTVSEFVAIGNPVIAGIPYLLTATLFVKAGYAFNKIKDY